MESTSVSMEQIQLMLAGSQRLNQLKREIDAIIGIALGFLTKAEVRRFYYGQVICEFTTPGLNWKIITWKGQGVDTIASDARNTCVYSSAWGSNQVEMQDIQSVHQALPEVLTNLVRVFPSIAEGFAWLLQAVPK